jgi:hypothetical protein
MNKKLLLALGAAGILGTNAARDLPRDMHRWLLDMHSAQVELLKIDWGRPGFCTEWDRDYNPDARSCGKRGKLIERRYSK